MGIICIGGASARIDINFWKKSKEYKQTLENAYMWESERIRVTM